MKCPNCGEEVEGYWCSKCGKSEKSGKTYWAKVWAISIAVLLMFPIAIFGACSVVVIVNEGPNNANERGTFVLLALIAFVLVGLLGSAVVKLWRK